MERGIVRTVLRILRDRPALLVFPLVTAAGWAVLAGVAWLTPLSGAWDLVRRGHPPAPGQDAGLVAVLLGMSCVSVYASAALLHAVHRLASGERPPVLAVLAVTARRLPVLLGWAVLRSTAGLALRVLEATGLGSVVSAVAGFSWSLAGCFVLPVLVVEGGGLFPGLRRSAALAGRYGGGRGSGAARGTLTLGGDQTAGAVRGVLVLGGVLVVGLFALILGVRAGVPLPAVLGAVAAVFLLTVLVVATGSGIYRTHLYLRAVAPPRPARTPAAAAGAPGPVA